MKQSKLREWKICKNYKKKLEKNIAIKCKAKLAQKTYREKISKKKKWSQTTKEISTKLGIIHGNAIDGKVATELSKLPLSKSQVCVYSIYVKQNRVGK